MKNLSLLYRIIKTTKIQPDRIQAIKSMVATALLFFVALAISACMFTPPGSGHSGAVSSSAGGTPTRTTAVAPRLPSEADGYYPLSIYPRPVPMLHSPVILPREMYEPTHGIYLGAWLSADTSLRIFEHETGKRHAVYALEMSLCEEAPASWILHNIAAQATPLIAVTPPRIGEETPVTAQILSLAKELGAFNLPMFIAFFPPGHGLDAIEYRLLFRYARAVFLEHAPLAAFIWVSPNAAANTQSPFYPGHDAVDWVGLSLLAARDDSGEKRDITAELERFYSNFYTFKPIALLPVGISHFSRGDYTYRINETADDLTRFYNNLLTFPRVGMVVYADFLTVSASNANDFSVSHTPVLTQAYTAAISHSGFLSALEINDEPITLQTRSAFHGYKWDDHVYLGIQALENELNITPPRRMREINEREFINSGYISGINVNFCEEIDAIIIDAVLD